MAPVWWCPNDQTVLANEQVLEGNVCERCGTEVYKRDLEQWYFRSPTTPTSCWQDLDKLDWPERVKTMQRNWIGRSEGARLIFTLETGDDARGLHDAAGYGLGRDLHGAGAGAPLVAKITTPEQRARSRRIIGRRASKTEIERHVDRCEPDRRPASSPAPIAINPVNDERIPIWIADYVLMGYGTGAIMAVPAHDQRDFEFARAFDLPIRVVVQPEGEPDSTGDDDRGVCRRRRDGQFRADSTGRPVPEARAGDHRLAGRAGPRQGGGQLPTARLVDLPSALLGHADPGRSIATTAAWCRCPSGNCRSCCRWMPSSRRPAEPAGDARSVSEYDVPELRRPGAARNRHDGHVRRFVLVLVPLHQPA